MDFVSGELGKLERRQFDLKKRLDLKTKELEALNDNALSLQQSKKDVRALVERLQGRHGEELFLLRAQIAARLKTLVKTLAIASPGYGSRSERLIEFLRSQPAEVVDYVREQLELQIGDRPYFAVCFRNGTIRVVYPNECDRLSYDEQVLVNGEGFAVHSNLLDEALTG